MLISSSGIPTIPKEFHGLRVLLIEQNKTSLEHHIDILSQNSYRVTTAMNVSTGWSLILNGNTYDCVLIDADILEVDMMDFLHQIMKHKPQLSIIMMASECTHMELIIEALKHDAIMCLIKPCDLGDICTIWKHVSRRRLAFKERDSNGKSTEEGLNINSHENGTMFLPVTYKLLFGHDEDEDDDDEHVAVDETTVNNNITTFRTTKKKVDKGKQLVECKRKNAKPIEDGNYLKKRKVYKPRLNWSPALHEKFLEALNAIGKQKAHPSLILRKMNVPGLTRSHVASHLQRYQECENIKKLTGVPQVRRSYKLQAECGLLNLDSSDNYASNIIQSSSSPKPMPLNSGGTAYMTLKNVFARFQKLHPLPVYSDQSTNRYFNNPHHLMGQKSMITTPGLAISPNSIHKGNEVDQMKGYYGYTNAMTLPGVGETVAPSFWNGFHNGNSNGASFSTGVNKDLAPLDFFGNATKSWVTGRTLTDHSLGAAVEPLRGTVAADGKYYNHEKIQTKNLFGMTTNTAIGEAATSSNHGHEGLALPGLRDPRNLGLSRPQDCMGIEIARKNKYNYL